jgi:hypothetical protein
MYTLSSFTYLLQANLEFPGSTSVHAFAPAEFFLSLSTSCSENEDNKGLTAFHSQKILISCILRVESLEWMLSTHTTLKI